MMKAILAVLLFASPVLAQDHPAAAAANGGCGSSETQFDVKTNEKQHPVATPDDARGARWRVGWGKQGQIVFLLLR
jgi:hypothetical protein